MAFVVVERHRSTRTSQALGCFTRRRHVHLRWNDRPPGAQRLLEMGRQSGLLVSTEDQGQDWTRTSARTRRVSTAQLHAHLRRRERRIADERALEVSLWLVWIDRYSEFIKVELSLCSTREARLLISYRYFGSSKVSNWIFRSENRLYKYWSSLMRAEGKISRVMKMFDR